MAWKLNDYSRRGNTRSQEEQDISSGPWECDGAEIDGVIDIDNILFIQDKQAQWVQRDGKGCALFFLQVELVYSVPLTDLGYKAVSESLDHTFLLFPGHCLGMAFSNLYYNFELRKFCNMRNLSHTECNEVCEYCKWNLLITFFIEI